MPPLRVSPCKRCARRKHACSAARANLGRRYHGNHASRTPCSCAMLGASLAVLGFASSPDGVWPAGVTPPEPVELIETRTSSGSYPKVGPNALPPAGYKAKSGSGPCKCRGSGTGLDSCGKLCCANSPWSATDPSSSYYFAKHPFASRRTAANLCWEAGTPASFVRNIVSQRTVQGKRQFTRSCDPAYTNAASWQAYASASK